MLVPINRHNILTLKSLQRFYKTKTKIQYYFPFMKLFKQHNLMHFILNNQFILNKIFNNKKKRINSKGFRVKIGRAHV